MAKSLAHSAATSLLGPSSIHVLLGRFQQKDYLRLDQLLEFFRWKTCDSGPAAIPPDSGLRREVSVALCILDSMSRREAADLVIEQFAS